MRGRAPGRAPAGAGHSPATAAALPLAIVTPGHSPGLKRVTSVDSGSAIDFTQVPRLHGGVESRRLGRTGLTVSRLGVGLAALGRPGYINLGHAEDLAHQYAITAMRARTHAVLDAAWEAGVRYFDAARSYGRAEEFLANWLASRPIAPDAAVVGSKWGYTYTAGWKASAEQH